MQRGNVYMTLDNVGKTSLMYLVVLMSADGKNGSGRVVLLVVYYSFLELDMVTRLNVFHFYQLT